MQGNFDFDKSFISGTYRVSKNFEEVELFDDNSTKENKFSLVG